MVKEAQVNTFFMRLQELTENEQREGMKLILQLERMNYEDGLKSLIF